MGVGGWGWVVGGGGRWLGVGVGGWGVGGWGWVVGGGGGGGLGILLYMHVRVHTCVHTRNGIRYIFSA